MEQSNETTKDGDIWYEADKSVCKKGNSAQRSHCFGTGIHGVGETGQRVSGVHGLQDHGAAVLPYDGHGRL